MQKISVVIPVYNSEKYINNCVNSMLNQDYENVEIILVDDGSQDSSKLLIDNFAQLNPDKIIAIHKQNGGVASARNLGLKYVTGDYIMFLDSDDFLQENCLGKLVEKAKEKNADIVRFGICYEYKDKTFKYEKQEFEDGFYIIKDQFKQHIYKKMLTSIKFNAVWRTLFKKDIVKNIKFREDMKTAEDMIFCIEAYTNANSFLYVGDIFYHYYQTNEGLTGKGLSVLEKYKCNYKVSKTLVEYLYKWNMDNIYYKFIAYFRMFLITFDKVKRRFKFV